MSATTEDTKQVSDELLVASRSTRAIAGSKSSKAVTATTTSTKKKAPNTNSVGQLEQGKREDQQQQQQQQRERVKLLSTTSNSSNSISNSTSSSDHHVDSVVEKNQHEGRFGVFTDASTSVAADEHIQVQVGGDNDHTAQSRKMQSYSYSYSKYYEPPVTAEPTPARKSSQSGANKPLLLLFCIVRYESCVLF